MSIKFLYPRFKKYDKSGSVWDRGQGFDFSFNTQIEYEVHGYSWDDRDTKHLTILIFGFGFALMF